MTYGWAILIIAIVMIALFQLGIFNSTNFTPYATAGACQVVKNVQGSSLAGQCSNELPKFVGQFNGVGYITTTYNPVGLTQAGMTKVSISAWAYLSSYEGYPQISASQIQNLNECAYCLQGSSGSPQYLTFSIGPSGATSSYPLPLNTWQYVVGTYDGATINIYVNGALQGSHYYPSVTFNGADPITIGSGNPGALNWIGQISNLQIYNISLSQSEVTALYQEGIGGAPIDPTHIVGWWPLNGNAQDYSGNNNGGVPTSISYTASWASGYTQP